MIIITLQIAIPVENIKEYKSYSLSQLEIDPNISGYFKLETKNFSFGFSQNKPIEDDEQGWDILTIWLENLLIIAKEIKNKKYIAIGNIENFKTYLEFKLDEMNNISIRELQIENSNDLVLYKEPKVFECKSQSEKISLLEFQNEVTKSKNSFLNELSEINPLFMKVNEIRRLSTFKFT